MANVPDAEWLVLVDGLDEILVGDERRRIVDALADELADPALPYRLVITSRPLPGWELAALRVAGTAEYEFCRFSYEDLAEFARRWFATGDGHAADHFLDQIDHARLGAIVAVPLLATIAATVFQGDAGHLSPSRSGLYERFVSYLLQERQIRAKRPGRFYYRLPALETLDHLTYRTLALGFPFLTTGLILGALWARTSWGSLFAPDPLAFFSVVAWIIYAGTLAGRAAGGWHGRRAAYYAIVGFAALVLTLGAGLFLPGMHGA